jgi:hypothetical protein
MERRGDRGRPIIPSKLAVVLVEQWQLQAIARLGMVAVGLRLEEVVPGHAVVVGDHLPVLLGAEQLLLVWLK